VAAAPAALVVVLMLAAFRGGAPTHHLGRALLVVWLGAALFVGRAASVAFRQRSDRNRFALAAVLSLAIGARLVRAPWIHANSFRSRAAELAIGAAVAGDRAAILLEVIDYGYYAVLAASGRPDAFVLDRRVGPRGPLGESSFRSHDALRRRIAEVSATHVVGRKGAATEPLGQPAQQTGAWALWELALR
jgi:hypothetical protein